MFRVYYTTTTGVEYYWTGKGWSNNTRDAKLLQEPEAAQVAGNTFSEYEEVATRPLRPMFLLIQDDVIVDRAGYIGMLRFHKISEYSGFKIAIGFTDFEDIRYIAGVLADVAPLIGSKYWCISIGSLEEVLDAEFYNPANYVSCRLRRDTFLRESMIDPNSQLPPTLTIRPLVTAHDRELNDVVPSPS